MVHVYEGHLSSVIYRNFMIALIVLSLIPLTTKEDPSWFRSLEAFCFVFFVADYLLRWISADFKFQNPSWKAFVKYPLRPISLIDLLTVAALASSIFGGIPGVRGTEALSVFRVVRIFRYSASIRVILEILKRSRKPLIAVGNLAIGYILISAIVIYNVEPETFDSFFEAVYWATVSLTTVGYGDIYPVTLIGRVVTMLSSFFGIAVVALPAGIVTAQYLDSLNDGEDSV